MGYYQEPSTRDIYEIILLTALGDQVEGYYDRLRVLRLVATSWSAVIDNHPKFWTTLSSSRGLSEVLSGIVDGAAGRKLELVVGSDDEPVSRITMSGFEVQLWDHVRDKLTYQTTLTQLFEMLPPSRREAVTTVEIGSMESNLVLAVLPIVHSFFPNASHLTIPRITQDIEIALGRPNEGWLFPRLETLSLSRHNNRHRRLMGVIKPRLKASEAGEHVAQIKTLILKFIRWRHIDYAEIAELDALVPNVVVEHPEVVSRSNIFDIYSKGNGLK